MPAIAVRQDSFSFEKEVHAGVTLVTMHGTLNETFEAKQLAASIRTNRVLVSMADIRRFASWGMSEWMEFLRATSECDLYLVECSTYSVSQLNLVTGLLGHAKLVSFYASYRCGTCSEEMQTLFLIPRDRAMIPEIPNSHHDCKTCGGTARLEEYPAAFFDAIAARPAFDIDDEALAFMRTRLHYDLSPDLSRFRAFRRTRGDQTFMRLSGNISTLPIDTVARAAQGVTVIDLANIVYERSQLRSWHEFLKTAAANVRSLQLMNCPAGFLEVGVTPEELHGRVKVRSFTQGHVCETCGTTTAQLIDVAVNLEHLVMGVIPPTRCPSCRSQLQAPVSAELDPILRALPARDRDVELESFLTKAQGDPDDKLENVLAPTRQPARKSSRLPIAIGAVAVLAAAGIAAWRSDDHKTVPAADKELAATRDKGKETEKPAAAFTRPDWITSDVPASGYCTDLTNRLVCVGVSAYTKNRDEGVGEATDVALEELVNTIGLRVMDPFFRDTVVPSYAQPRAKLLSSLQGATKTEANESVKAMRKQIVGVLRATGGAAVPVQRSDWYWEEYAGEAGSDSAGSAAGATEFLVFVRYDVSTDAVHALLDRYSASATVPPSNATAMTAFPELAWKSPRLAGGALITRPGSRLERAGIKAGDIVTAVAGESVADATAFAKKLTDKPVKLTVLANDGDKVIDVR